MDTTNKLLLAAGAIIVALLAVIITLQFADRDGGGGAGKPPFASIKPGETRTRAEIEEAGVETIAPAKVDTSRLEATYEVGKTYGAMAKVAVQSRGSHKDWGVSTDMTFNYAGEFQLSRFIEANDGQNMTVVMQVDRAITVSAFTAIDQIKIELGPLTQSALELSGPSLGLPPGYSEVTKETLEQILNHQWSRSFLTELATDETAKAFAFVDSLQGKKARVVISNGTGVESITSVDCELSAEEQLFFESASFYSDVVLMQDLECKPGDTWRVDGRDLMPLLDPSMNANVEGTLTLRRREDLAGIGAEKPKALLSIENGVLNLKERYSERGGNTTRQMGSWAPVGDLIFDFGQNLVTEARLSGSVELVEESTDHILFEMRNTISPTYEVQYSAWKEQGNQLEVRLDNGPPPVVGPAVLDTLKKRLGQ